MNRTIAILDPSEHFRFLISMTLRGAGYLTREARDFEGALEILPDPKIILVLLDSEFPRLGSGEVLSGRAGLPVVELFRFGGEPRAQTGFPAEATGVPAGRLAKPFDPALLIEAVRKHAKANGSA